MKHLSALFIVLISVVASVTVTKFLDEDPVPLSAPRAVPGMGELESRVARLEEAVDRLASAPAPLAAPPVVYERVAANGDEDELTAMLERIDRLEVQLAAALRQVDVRGPTPAEIAQAELDEHLSREAAIASAQFTITDPAASIEDKVAAQKTLRRVEDAYTPEMVAELLQIASNDPVGELRADVWTYFDGSTHLPELAPHLRDSLANDSSARAREEAAETLGNYLSDPVNLEALKWAAEFDANPRVRKKARRTLGE